MSKTIPLFQKFPHEHLYGIGTKLNLRPCSPGSLPVRAEIVDRYGVGLQRRSQVVRLRIITDIDKSGFSPDSFVIAKFYDPLYVLEYERQNESVCLASEKAEKTAYEILRDFQGTDIPKFFGEYVWDRSISQYSSIKVILLEFVEGPSLSECYHYSKLTANELKELKTQVIDVICRIHQRNIYHRDINSSNILLRDGRPVIVDFGIASNPKDINQKNRDELTDELDIDSTFPSLESMQ